MPVVDPTHVVSFSSEDPHHPATNLLNLDTFRKWKCKDVGEKEAYVILKFEKAETITAIDIGNDGSALVEVLVARSGNGSEPQFEVLLSSTAFMSPNDSRENKNLNKVRNFTLATLSKPIAAQKWDLVKVLCSQPFNKHIQYGLSFVKFICAPDPNEPKKIGVFSLKTSNLGADSDEEDAKPGLLFSTFSKSPKNGTGSPSTSTTPSSSFRNSPTVATNIEIMNTLGKLSSAAKSGSSSDVKNIIKSSKPDVPSPPPSSNGSRAQSNRSDNSSPMTPISRKQLADRPSFSKKKDDKPSSNVVSSSPTLSTNKNNKKRPLSPDDEPSSSSRSFSPSTNKTKATTSKPKKPKKTKPFNKLFEGVVFSMSGFQNPLRGQLRDKAVEMGARYKADWDGSCTHLICAFYNTPKFREVRTAGNGNIVTKNWIEESYSNKCRYPWRRYYLDRNDRGPESEEEIFAETGESEEEVMDANEEDANLSEEDVKTKRKRILVMDSSEESDNSNDSGKAYNKDTDVDEDNDQTPDLSPSMLDSSDTSTPFFENKGFCLENAISDTAASELAKVITKHKGQIHKKLDDTVEYYVCENEDWKEDFSDALSDNPNLMFVHQDWIFKCHEGNCLIDVDSFLLSPQ